MKNRIKFLSLAGLMAISNLSQSSPITDDYHSGDRLTAKMMENIKNAVNDNNMQINAFHPGPKEIAIDCSANADAFANTGIEDNVTYTLTGMCNGPIQIESHNNVTIRGDATGSKDDGVQLPAGLTEQPYAAIGIWQSNGVVLDNLTVSAANYVSETYAFGNNVSAVHVGNKSLAEALSVDFVGGDYSVHVYNDGMLTLGEGNTVTGFNIGGLTAYNHGLIRTLDDITVTGLVGTSNQGDPNALQATNNGIVEIRNGGTFAGPTGGEQDPAYHTAVWASDNGTIRIKAGANPATVNGGVASSMSAVIRVEGNTTVNGYVGAYHLGYTRIAGTTQYGGLIEVGDGGYLRFDSSSLNPQGTVGIYRMGKMRAGNTDMHIADNLIDVSGFGMLNLRLGTTLNGANIDCHESRLVSIHGSITDVGTVSCYFQP